MVQVEAAESQLSISPYVALRSLLLPWFKSELEAALALKPPEKGEGALISSISKASSIDELLPLISEARGLARLEAVSKLAELARNSEIREKILSLLREPSYEKVSGDLLVALGKLGLENGLPVTENIISVFDELPDSVKAQACVVLGVLRDEKAADLVWSFLQRVSGDRQLSTAALMALVDLGDDRANDIIVSALEKGDFTVEHLGLAARIGDERVVKPIMKLALLSDNPRLRVAAINVLAYIVKMKGTRPILPYLSHSKKTIKRLARQVVKLSRQPLSYFKLFHPLDKEFY
ncbi:MAG: hypothetical protein QXN15_04150 [Candidatus Jordarchaeales archaeon]|nr:hypothetical protein [Candidatus Jordarchaeia archaeon]